MKDIAWSEGPGTVMIRCLRCSRDLGLRDWRASAPAVCVRCERTPTAPHPYWFRTAHDKPVRR